MASGRVVNLIFSSIEKFTLGTVKFFYRDNFDIQAGMKIQHNNEKKFEFSYKIQIFNGQSLSQKKKFYCKWCKISILNVEFIVHQRCAKYRRSMDVLNNEASSL